MPNFTNTEYADIHFIYGFCNGNAAEASREYGRRFPNRRRPNAQVFVQVHRRFRECGLNRNPRNEYERNERQRNEILNLFDENNRLSSRNAVRQLRTRNVIVSKTKVLRILRRDGRKPYHLQPVQHLLPEDGPRRINFCNWILRSVDADNRFLNKIIWTDEATFSRRGVVNFHNLHVWSHENPHEIRPRSFQTEFSVNVWVGIQDNHLCGPHFLPPRLNSQLFLHFLENDFINYLEEIPLNQRQEAWFQMDGAPAHYGLNVINWCNNNFPRRWIGRLRVPGEGYVPTRGPAAWPPRSPDLNVLDFFVWGFLVDLVYSTPVDTREELVVRIQNACQTLQNNQHQIRAAVNSVQRRCRKCIEANGMNFEQLL